MLTYRAFSNMDPPALAAIWRSRAGQAGLAQPVSADLFEQFVFGKPYFDYQGLTLAFDDDRPVGFAHAAFGPNEKQDRIATEKGVVCVVMVRPDCAEAEVAGGLLGRSEDYLHRRGAKVVYGGAVAPLNPFYLGLYGGSQLPGVLETDLVARELFRSHGYDEIDRTYLFRRPLGDFRPRVDRYQMQFRRQMVVDVKMDPPARTWWEACVTADLDLLRFEVSRRGDETVLASATYRGMEPTGNSPPGRAAGLLDLEVALSHRRKGLATFLLGESFRRLARQGVAVIEAQATGHNPPSVELCRKLGMESTDQGVVFSKSLVGR